MANQAAAPVKLFVLGDARIETPKGLIEPTAELVFAAALYFVLERGVATSRRALEEILWPAATRPIASHRLRQTLLRLRRLGIPVEDVGRSSLVLAASGVEIDANAEDMRNMNSDHSPVGAFMPGYLPSFSRPFADWLDSHRNRIAGEITRQLLTSIADYRARGRWSDVERLASHLLRSDPLNEEATLALAECLAMRGSKVDAVRLLDTYLAELGRAPADLKLPASIVRRRILDRIPADQPRSHGSSIFVGREAPMSQLCAMLQTVKAGTGSAVIVSGEAGIGKSRLVTEFASFASLQGFSVLRVACRSGDVSRPLSVFVDLVPMIRQLRGAIGCSAETIRCLDRISFHGGEGAATDAPLGEAEWAYARVRQALLDVLDAVADEAPLMVVVDDVHRLDDSSKSLIAHLIPWTAQRRILFTFTTRGSGAIWLDEINDSITDIPLAPLDDDSAASLVIATAGFRERTIGSEDVAWCVKVAEGNPYFLGELASHWVETGESHTAPRSLAAVINQRLERLKLPTLQLLQTCALLENNCTIERVERVLGYEHHQLLQSINELGKLGMITQESSDGLGEALGRLSPRHELLAAAAIRNLSPPARAFLHRRIGAVMEEETRDNQSAALMWDCAKHWQLSGDVTRALLLARSSANHLMALGLCTLAADAYEKALQFCSSEADRLEILEAQVAAYFQASDWEQLAVAAQRFRSIQRYLDPSANGHDDVELMEVRALWLRGDLVSATERARLCLAATCATETHRVKAGTLTLMLHDLACDHSLMRSTFQSMEPLFEGPDLEPSLRLESQMVFETVCGELSKGMDAASGLIDARRRADSVADLMRALTNGAIAARTAGELTQARHWLHEALEIAGAHKLPLASEIPMQALASMALDEGDLAEAKRWYDALKVLPTKTFDSTTIRNSIGLRIALIEGDVSEARRLVHSDIPQLAADPNPHRRTYGLALLVAVEMAEGRLPSQEPLAQLEASHLISRRNARQAFATFVLVTALRKVGKQRRAEELLTSYRDVHRREAGPLPTHLAQLFVRPRSVS